MVRLDAAQVPQAEALLELAGAVAIAFDDAEDHPLLEPRPGEMPLWPTVTVRALFPSDCNLAALRAALADACAPANVAALVLDDSEWRNALQRAPTARRIGARLWLTSADGGVAPDGLVHVRLRMGVAFGTGEHPTTALCLEWLATHLRAGARVLDFGCGSGVLAVAALALGAQSAWAVDIEPQALAATRDNAELNGVLDRLWIGPPDELPKTRVDVVVANVLADPLERLAPVFRDRLAEDGIVVLSGILNDQRARIERAYAQCFDRFTSTGRAGWLLLTARVRATPDTR